MPRCFSTGSSWRKRLGPGRWAAVCRRENRTAQAEAEPQSRRGEAEAQREKRARGGAPVAGRAWQTSEGIVVKTPGSFLGVEWAIVAGRE